MHLKYFDIFEQFFLKTVLSIILQCFDNQGFTSNSWVSLASAITSGESGIP